MNKIGWRFLLVSLVLVGILLVSCDSGDTGESDSESKEMEEMAGDDAQASGMPMQGIPDDLDTSRSKETENGVFNVTVSSELDPLALNKIHSWIVHIKSQDGEAVENAEIVVGGGMPQHNHGFPTAPEVTEELGEGDYRIEGMKFSMGGWWELQLSINTAAGSDSVTFNIVLPQ
jgi:hypothetical protein